MADSAQITSSAVIHTQTTTDATTLAPGSWVKLSPAHPYSSRGALLMQGEVNALDDFALMMNVSQGPPAPPQLTVWLHSAKGRRFRLSFDFSGKGDNPAIAYFVHMPDDTTQFFYANQVIFEFTTPNTRGISSGCGGAGTRMLPRCLNTRSTAVTSNISGRPSK